MSLRRIPFQKNNFTELEGSLEISLKSVAENLHRKESQDEWIDEMIDNYAISTGCIKIHGV